MKHMKMLRLLCAIIAALTIASHANAATDDWSSYQSASDGPLNHGAVVTPSDSTDLTDVSRACLVGTSGNIKLTTIGGETITVPSVPVGWHPFRVTRIWSTGTTASNISCWW